MHKISEIVSKPVLTLFEGENVGTVGSFLLSEKQNKIKGFFVLNDESEVENFISSSEIFAIGENSVIIKNLDKLKPIFNVENKGQIINQEALTITGDSLGKIKDVFFDKEFSVCSYETTSGVVLSPNNLLKIGKDVVFFDVENLNLKISNFKPKNAIKIQDLPEIKVQILQENPETPQKRIEIPIISNNFTQSNFEQTRIINQTEKTNKKQQIVFPQKATALKSVVGKTANKTIIGLNGEVVVRDTQKITPEIYEKAKKHSKLFELSSSVE